MRNTCNPRILDILDLGTSWRWVVKFMARPLYPIERASDTHWIGGCVGPRICLDNVERRKILPLLELELWPLGRPTNSQSLYRPRYLITLIIFGSITMAASSKTYTRTTWTLSSWIRFPAEARIYVWFPYIYYLCLYDEATRAQRVPRYRLQDSMIQKLILNRNSWCLHGEARAAP
jgi:hypothetical protein